MPWTMYLVVTMPRVRHPNWVPRGQKQVHRITLITNNVNDLMKRTYLLGWHGGLLFSGSPSLFACIIILLWW